MPTPPSPYLLLFHDSSAERYKSLSPSERQHLLERWTLWYDRLANEGKLRHGHPLEPEGRVISGYRGERVIETPFFGSREAIAGYFLLTVSSLDEASAIARQCPGLDYGITIEVRPVAEVCPILSASAQPATGNLVNA